MLERIDLAMLPAEAEAMPSEAYIVVDVLRATTTIATLFAGGMTSLIAAGRLELARDLAAAEGRLLMGEVGGLPPAGFDFGNSPVEAAAAPVDDSEVSEDGRYLIVSVSQGTDERNRLFYRDLTTANAPMVELIAELEAELGKPVVSSNQATFWNVLRTLKLNTRIKGFGRLLEDF